MFSERLKALRKERGISQRALAQRLGVSQQAVAKWEAASSTPGPNALATIADVLGVSSDYLLGRERDFQDGAQDTARLPVLGTVKAGYGAYAFEEDYGTAPAQVRDPRDYFYLIVRGDSMEPRIHSGDLALVHRQPDVESGELAVVLVAGEEGTLKRVIKKEGAVILQPFNQAYQPQVFIGEELEQPVIIGKVVETKTRW